MEFKWSVPTSVVLVAILMSSYVQDGFNLVLYTHFQEIIVGFKMLLNNLIFWVLLFYNQQGLI